MCYFRKALYCIVFIGVSSSFAGSYDDFFVAIKQDDVDTVRALLKRGFDPNTRNPAGEHGLALAIREPSLKVASVLAGTAQIDPEARNEHDESLLMLAALKGLFAVCEQLIAKGADVNKPGWTPLHYAATHGHISVMNLLLDNHAYIDAASPNGSTPLMMAALYGTPAAVKVLLEAGADPRLKNDQGLTAIDFANRGQRSESAALLAAFVRSLQPAGKW
jgi:ankyrin repeat protein